MVLVFAETKDHGWSTRAIEEVDETDRPEKRKNELPAYKKEKREYFKQTMKEVEAKLATATQDETQVKPDI